MVNIYEILINTNNFTDSHIRKNSYFVKKDMSRIGKKPISIPDGVTVKATDNNIFVKGPKGELERVLHDDIGLEIREKEIIVVMRRETKKTNALWGLSRSLVANMVEGVAKGFKKELEFEGIGFRASVEGGNSLQMQLGFSHPVRFKAPEGITFNVEKNIITVSGINKELVGETAASVRALKPPEPYKGKGIRYRGEVIIRKAGKKAVASA